MEHVAREIRLRAYLRSCIYNIERELAIVQYEVVYHFIDLRNDLLHIIVRCMFDNVYVC
jgi:hypothetical protein